MTIRTLKMALLVAFAVIGSLLASYMRVFFEKDFLDYLSGFSSLMGGIFLLIVSYRNGKGTETGQRASNVLPICGIMMVISGTIILIIKLFG